jgi:hypothetical protein
MRFVLNFTTAVLLVAIGIGGVTSTMAADRQARNAIMGRQKIREEISAAMAKGHLTPTDQYRILLHGKDLLTPEDYVGLEQTLDRIVRQQAVARTMAKPVASVRSIRQDPPTDEVDVVMPSKYEEPRAEKPAIGEQKGDKTHDKAGSPFVEEVPAGIANPAIHLNPDDAENCEDEEELGMLRRRWISFDFLSSIDAFKGPVDIGNANGNFGVRLGIEGAMPILPRMGIALEGGVSTVLSNLKGSPYPAPNASIRDQVFTTAGLFQRINLQDGGAVTWGFAYDWLFDDYYSNFHFGQWRVKGAYEFSPYNEVGILAALPEHGSTGQIPNFFGGVDDLHFKPITQGYVYWKHTWCNEASLTGRLGMAERPGLMVFGAESRVPLTQGLALTGDFNYIMPNAAGGSIAQTQEMWNVSVGIEIVPGGFGRCGRTCLQPFLPVANNGSMAIRELGP